MAHLCAGLLLCLSAAGGVQAESAVRIVQPGTVAQPPAQPRTAILQFWLHSMAKPGSYPRYPVAHARRRHCGARRRHTHTVLWADVYTCGRMLCAASNRF